MARHHLFFLCLPPFLGVDYVLTDCPFNRGKIEPHLRNALDFLGIGVMRVGTVSDMTSLSSSHH